MKCICLLALTCFVLFVLLKEYSANKTRLNVGALLERTGAWSSKFVKSFDKVLEYVFSTIDNRTDILDGFEFRLTVRDTEGNSGLAATHLMDMIKGGEPKIAIIGPTHPAGLTVTGLISPVYNVLQLSCMAMSASTVNRAHYPTLVKVIVGYELLNHLRIKMMRHFGWTRVGTIVFQDDWAVSQMAMFHQLLRDNNMTLVSSAVFSSVSEWDLTGKREYTDFKDIISAFKQFDVRIIMTAIHGRDVAAMFCEAYKQGMYGPSYVWVLIGSLMHHGWDNVENAQGCTMEELTMAIDGHFWLNNLYRSISDEPTISVKTTAEEMAVLRDILTPLPNNVHEMFTFVPYVMDTAWALAIGLNNSLRYLEEAGLSLHNYTNSPHFIGPIMKGMLDSSFDGVSGPVSFDEFGSRIGLTSIQQTFVNESNNFIVAMYDLTNDVLMWNVPEYSIWKDGRAPQDRFTYRESIVWAGLPATISIFTMNSLGLILSTIFLSFNVSYRHSRSIKMSSPMINNVIIVGCIIMYIDVYVNAADNSHTTDSSTIGIVCMVHVWLISVGFTLLFGALFAKTYRVYAIFQDYQLKQKHIRDYHLFVMIGVMLLVDCIILVPWTTFFPLYSERLVIMRKDIHDNNVILLEVHMYCYNQLEAYWLITIYVYKGLLLVFGVFLAYQTHNVTVPELNDSKYIGACIYNVVVICIFGVPLVHVLPIDQRTLKSVLESCLVFFCTTICQCILFIPKIKNRNKVHGQMLQVKPTTTGSVTGDGSTTVRTVKCDNKAATGRETVSTQCMTGSSYSGDTGYNYKESATVEALESEIKQLRHQIAWESIAVEKLKESILSVSGNIHFYKSGDEYVVVKVNAPRAKGDLNRSTPKLSDVQC